MAVASLILEQYRETVGLHRRPVSPHARRPGDMLNIVVGVLQSGHVPGLDASPRAMIAGAVRASRGTLMSPV